jgi:23S rRNA (guanosine2251-2'-O)-methyltransferase
MGPAGRRLHPAELAARHGDDVGARPRLPVCAILENIRSLWNVGSMFRSADAARLQGLHLCGYTPHPPREEIDKTALGAVDHVPWQYWTTAADACDWLRARGYRLLALEHTDRSVDIDAVPLGPRVAFVVGNEVMGVSDTVLARCDAAMDIPMYGHKESLNVAVAFGVAAYTLRRRLQETFVP